MPGYDRLYADFDSDVMRRVRAEAYGEDVGQHSWVTAKELDGAVDALALTPSSRLLDVGCGPGGPLTYIARRCRCSAVGMDVSSDAIAAARRRIAELNLEELVSVMPGNADDRLPFPDGAFDAVMAIDVVLHLRNRHDLLREVARVLAPRGRLWFTDAGVVTGAVSNQEIEFRSIHGLTQFAPPGFNERALEQAGLTLLQTGDRTEDLLANAVGRIEARLRHRAEVIRVEGKEQFERQLRYLETVVALAKRGAVSRYAYVAAAG